MSRFYSVQLGTIYWTSDETSAGRGCKVLARGVEAFRSPYARSIVHSASGKAYKFLADIQDEGKHFELELTNCPVSLYESLIAFLNEAEESGETFRLIASGLPASFDVQAMTDEDWLSTGEFSGGFINNVVLRFVSAGAGGA